MTPLETLLLTTLAAGGAGFWWLRGRWRRDRETLARELAGQATRYEAEIAARGRRTEALFDRMVEGVIVLGTDGRILMANRAAGALFDFAPPATGRTAIEATRRHEVATLVARLERETQVLDHELRIDGVAETRYLQVNALALRAPDGSRDGAILVFHDLTRLRRLEATRQEFVANVSHELRTPLSLIKSAAETLVDGGKDDPAVTARFLEIIEKNSSRLALLIDDLLLLARLDSGRIELKLAAVPLRAAAQEALDDAAVIARLRRVSLENRVTGEVIAQADPERLRQVLANLIDNAIKYGREGGVVVVGGRSLDADRIELTVRDDGPGIPADATARIFERFYRVDKARSREQGGTGLGLAIVKNVVQAHGGEVRVESEPGRGAEFFITLPAGKKS